MYRKCSKGRLRIERAGPAAVLKLLSLFIALPRSVLECIDLGKMGVNEERALDICTPPLTPIANSKFENGKYDSGHLNGGSENVEYTLKPAMRAYASTARYSTTYPKNISITERSHPCAE